MSKHFRAWDPDQMWLFPPAVSDLLPPDHAAHLIRDTVRDCLNLSAIVDDYDDPRGAPPYDPRMMTALLLYGYCMGIYSSRRLAQACSLQVDFMAITAFQAPDFRTISDFRLRHIERLRELFVQVLTLCDKVGLARLGHVALDGTKMEANASKHKAMSYGRMNRDLPKLRGQVRTWFREAEKADRLDDGGAKTTPRTTNPPQWVLTKQSRIKKIRGAMRDLEAEATALRDRDSERPPRKRSSKPARPTDSAQRNFTDPESRIMKGANGFVQAYNCQAVVAAGSQVVVASLAVNEATDQAQLRPMLVEIKKNLGRQAEEMSADAGYCSEGNLAELERRHVEGYVATGRQKHGKATATKDARPGTRRAAMGTKLRKAGRRSRYRLRKYTVEPIFGQIKHDRGFRRFHLRGLSHANSEWAIVCTAHNLLKLTNSRRFRNLLRSGRLRRLIISRTPS